jgi:predicted MFS family arabinose efflux permease
VSPTKKNPWVLISVLCLAAGVSNVDIFGISYVTPFIEKSLSFDNTQIGLLLSGFWLTFAISNYVTGAVADRHRNHKAILLVMLLLFACFSVLPALTSMFSTLLATRLLMGVFDAGVYQLPQSIVVLETPAERHGLNMGIVQNLGGAFLGVVVAPLLLVRLAQAFGWRSAFLVVALPGLVCAALVARVVPGRRARPDSPLPVALDPDRGEALGLAQVLRIRNVWLSMVISCFIVGYMTIGFGFLPLYLMKIDHFAAARMSIVISIMGLAGAVLGVALPAASDRIGRKPVMIVSSVLGMGAPLAALYYTGPLAVLGAFMFIGAALIGAAPLTYATIPCESAPAETTSTVIGVILAVSAIVGGVAGPSVAGWSADRWGLAAPLYLAVVCCAASTVLCTALKESTPRKNSREKIAGAPAGTEGRCDASSRAASSGVPSRGPRSAAATAAAASTAGQPARAGAPGSP